MQTYAELMARARRELARLGGLAQPREAKVRGGKASMAGRTPEERRELGRKGAAGRWGRKDKHAQPL